MLQTPSSQLHLHLPEALNESHVVIGPKAMRDMIDHFPSTRGKADPQLIWVFDDTEVQVRSFETSLDGKGALDIVSSRLRINQCNAGAGQLATELTISADEFEDYDIFATPISLAFHLREFNVSLSFSTHPVFSSRRKDFSWVLTCIRHQSGDDCICRINGGHTRSAFHQSGRGSVRKRTE